MSTLTSRYLSGLESGKGLVGAGKSALKGSMDDFKSKNIKETLVRSFFGGDDIISAAIRGSFGVKKKPKKESSPESASKAEGGLGEDGSIFLKIIAKNSMALPGMARDMNVLRQNLQKLVKLKGGEASTGADAFFLKQGEREAALEAQSEKERGGEQKPDGEKDEGKKSNSLMQGFMRIIETFKNGLFTALKVIFNPKNLLKVLTKAGPIALLAAAIFSGFKGWKKFFETGSFKEGMIEGLGTMLDLLTFGLVDQESIRSAFDSLEEFFKPVTTTIGNIFDGIKSFFRNVFGKFIKVDDAPPKPAEGEKPPETPKEPPKKFDPEMNRQMAEEMKGLEKELSGESSGSSPVRVATEKQVTTFVQKHEKLAQKFSQGNASSPEGIAKEIEYVDYKKQYFESLRDSAAKRGMADQATEYQKVVNIYNNRLSELNELQKAKSTTSPTPTAPDPGTPPAAAASGGAAGGSLSSGGGASGGGAAAAPSVESGATTPSGEAVADASTQVAEAQRMESSSEMESSIQQPTINNVSGSTGKETTVIADAYDSELAEFLTS
jgi:hypothetical protein